MSFTFNEPDILEVERANHSLHNMINLEFDQYAARKADRDAPRKLARESGFRETVYKDQGDGALSFREIFHAGGQPFILRILR